MVLRFRLPLKIFGQQLSYMLNGDLLIKKEEGYANSKDDLVLNFSKQFMNKIEAMKQSNFELKTAKVNFIVYWLKEEAQQEVKVILPELYFEKQQNR